MRRSLTCSAGPYLDHIKALCGSNPGLKTRDPANKESQMRDGNAKVVLLESPPTKQPEFSRTDFKSVTELRRHFEENKDSHAQRRVYIMEGLARDYIAAMGDHFFMDPSFFVRQERTCPWSNDFTPTSDALPPPSSLNPEKTFLLQYCELRQFQASLPNAPFFCNETGRHVGMTAARTKNDTTVAILRRKVSWWCRTTEGGGWDVVILCDPQLRDLRPEPKRGRISNVPFQGGYLDFVPPPPHDRAASAPKHQHCSMLEDLCHYLTNHSSLLTDEEDSGQDEWRLPQTSSFFVKKIVAAHYLQLIDYIKAMLPSLELRLTTAWLEEQGQWKSLQTISRRCGNYHDDVEDILLSLGYRLDQNQVRTDWKDCETDFQYIYHRLKTLKQRADNLMQAMTGLASIAGNRQNLEEAKRVKRLNLLALFFIPLAYTSSLFSMQESYAPGNNKFWVYWVIAIGAVLFTVVATWALDSAFLDDSAQWKLPRPLKPFKRKISSLFSSESDRSTD
ncbi:uncharacterized protein EI97DRAFT_448921 [Westerdykella ornata]|uniref:Cora-domain-containing protein n=1 Tax=Westerdykella ornata TaxID=318751 RepID=A0A6A6JNX3_WESOR|nr:uncharacterized protein EI97DRAFT_448921 [Westerdykella ornata]KAF2278222.1 hypothetical protein EI97DRAFT_448921 [Westerdykella ornata]